MIFHGLQLLYWRTGKKEPNPIQENKKEENEKG
jgi:hypothetical protein